MRSRSPIRIEADFALGERAARFILVVSDTEDEYGTRRVTVADEDAKSGESSTRPIVVNCRRIRATSAGIPDQTNTMATDGTEQRSDGAERMISIVYVDDYDELCSLAKTGLETASDRLVVKTTTDPTSVTDRLGDVNCIVSDYEMPEVDGLELLRQVRVLDEDVPFILFTGEGSENIASDAISLGVIDYLTKGGGQERFIRLANRIEGGDRGPLGQRGRPADAHAGRRGHRT